MSNDFYCDEVLSGHTSVQKVIETATVLAFHHTRPYYPVHIVVIPKQHIASLLTLENDELLIEMFGIIREVAAQLVADHGSCRIVTNLGSYQDSRHLHWHIVFGDPIRATDLTMKESE